MFAIGNKNEIKDSQEVLKDANKKTPIPSIINSSMYVKGDISTDNIIDIVGKVEGSIRAKVVHIREGASVSGEIVSRYIKIGGDFKGNISSAIIHIASSGIVKGDLNYGIISIEERAKLEVVLKQELELLKLEEVSTKNITQADE